MHHALLKTYEITHDDIEARIVLAIDFSNAIALWRSKVISEWKEAKCYEEGDWPTPREVRMLNDEPVIAADMPSMAHGAMVVVSGDDVEKINPASDGSLVITFTGRRLIVGIDRRAVGLIAEHLP